MIGSACRWSAILILGASLVHADDTPRRLEKGDHVLPGEGCDIRDRQNSVVSLKGRALPLVVQSVNGDTVDVGLGIASSGTLVHVDDSEHYYAKWLGRDPNSLDAYHLRATARFDRRRYESAIEDLTQAIRLAPNNARLYVKRCIMSFEIRDQNDQALRVQHSIQDALTALRLDPQEILALVMLAFMYAEPAAADPLTSLQMERRARAGEPNDELTNYWLGMLCVGKGSPAEAKTYFDEAIRINPFYVDAYNERGLIYRKDGRFDLSRADYDRAVEIDPKSGKAHANLAMHFRIAGSDKEAVEEIENAIRLDPNSSAIWHACAKIHCTMTDTKYRNPARCLEAAKRAYELGPRSHGITYLLAVSYGEVGDFDSAIAWMNKLRSVRRHRPEDLYPQQIDETISRFHRKQPALHD